MLWLVAQRTVYDLRKDVYNKLGRLPLKYFDARTHGETLSRVTNDMDNISSTRREPDADDYLRCHAGRRYRDDAHDQSTTDVGGYSDLAA